MKSRFNAIHTEIDFGTPAELGRRMQRDQVRWVELIKAAGIEPE